VLDAVRAAGEVVDLAPRTVLWGHSQGGHTALWAGAEAASYAPELDLLGVAATAPATDLETILATTQDRTSGRRPGRRAGAGRAGHHGRLGPGHRAAGVGRRRCADGQRLEYVRYPDLDHTSLVAPASPLTGRLVAWTEARLAGEPTDDTC
jgi:hypothetical protein